MPQLLQCSYMPGDMFGIAAALILDPALRVTFLVDTNLGDNKSTDILRFYTECGLAPGRIDQVDVSALTCRAKGVWTEFVKRADTHVAPETVAWADPYPATATNAEKKREFDTKKALSAIYNLSAPAAWPQPVWYATERVAELFTADAGAAMTKVAEAWKTADLTARFKRQFDEFMTAAGITKLTGKVIVLWSRQSGKRGGAHVEMDSSYQGIRQLANLFSVAATVFLAGDEKDEKLAEFASRYPSVYNISNMWAHPLWGPFKEAGVSRLAQLTFFRILAQGRRVVHVGMRSGNLEAMAMLGMPTFFMEPTGSLSGDRMLAFERAGIPYSRVQFSQAPGLTARWGDTFSKAGASAATRNTWEDALEKEALRLLKDAGYNTDVLGREAPFQGKLGAVKARAGAQWNTALDSAKLTLKGLPYTLPSEELPAIDDAGKLHYRGFRIDDINTLARAVMRTLYAA